MEYIERNPLPEFCAQCADRLGCLTRGEGEWCCEECENLLERFPPQGFLQSKNALRRTSASKFAARQHNHQLSCKPVSACKSERECYQKPQKIAPLKGSSNLEPPGFQKGRGPFVSEGVQRKPF